MQILITRLEIKDLKIIVHHKQTNHYSQIAFNEKPQTIKSITRVFVQLGDSRGISERILWWSANNFQPPFCRMLCEQRSSFD